MSGHWHELTRGIWRRTARWKWRNGLEAIQTIRSSHSLSINVHRRINFTFNTCHHWPFVHHDLLRLQLNDKQLPTSPKGDNPSYNTVDQNTVWLNKCCFSLHVVLCRNAFSFSFSAVSVKGREKKTHSRCFCLVLEYLIPSFLWLKGFLSMLYF